MDLFLKAIGVVVVVILLIVALGFLFAYPMMLLWNSCLVPAVPVLQQVSWLQMWGIMILFGFLFKSSNVNSK